MKRLISGKFWSSVFVDMGFAGTRDYFATVLGLKIGEFFTLKVIGAAIAAVIAFTAEWIWIQPLAIGLFVVMNFINARYGYLVAKMKGEKFSWAKFKKTHSIIVSDLLIMAMLRNAIKLHPEYAWIGDILFGWLFGDKFRAILWHMAELKLQSEGLKGVLLHIANYIMKTKFGIDYTNETVEKIQKQETENKEKI